MTVHPEEYLLELLAADREATLSAVIADAARRTNPPAGPSELLASLAATVPTFANIAHQALQDHGPISDIPAYVIADPPDSPLSGLAAGGDLTDLHVAALWWLAILDPNTTSSNCGGSPTHPEPGATFKWAANLLSGKSLASKVYYAVDNPTDVAVVRFVPEVAETAQTFASFIIPGVVFLTLCRHDDGTWRAWGLGPRMVSARTVTT